MLYGDSHAKSWMSRSRKTLVRRVACLHIAHRSDLQLHRACHAKSRTMDVLRPKREKARQILEFPGPRKAENKFNARKSHIIYQSL